MKKRLISILLILCMMLCLIPTTVFAATQTVDSWSGLQNLMNSTNNLSVTLSSDISWGGSSLTVPVGKTVTLDLNGKAIDAQSKGTAIVVSGTLTIKNSGADLAGPIGVGAGPITGNIKNGKAIDQKAGGILVSGGGKLIMNSGWLTNCVDDSGKPIAAGGIYVSENAEFEMNGGIITGCTGSDLLCAAGVVNYGTFTMSGNATISGSRTKSGGDGVAICNVGTLNASGGTVQTGQSCTNNATIQNTGSATVFYCDVLNTGFGTIKGGTYSYPVENTGIITGGSFNKTVTSNGTINDGTFNGTVNNTGIVTGGTFNGATTGIYTVTFDSGVPSQIRANYPATAPDAPTRMGYTFDGWFKGGTQYDFIENVTENISLTANWTAKSYTVRFDTNGGTTIADKTLTWDDKVLTGVSDPVKAGFDFKGWTYGGRTVFANTTYANLAADDSVTSITLTAQWTALTYTVNFDTNGGNAVASQTVAYGGKAQEPAVPTKTGYAFAGWYLDDKAYDFTAPVTENMTLTARWTANQYTITFDTAGGSAVAPITLDYGTTITAPANPTREGYTFTGWDNAIPATMPAENMTITAQWTVNQYTITFDTAGGSAVTSITLGYGTAIAAPADPTREGYTFTGWNTAIPATMPAENMTITAQWKVNQYTITFDTNGGSEIAPVTQDYGTPVTDPADPTREGYTFTGWDNAIPATMPAENMTITAQWTVNQYTITFDTAGGSAVASITQDYGTAITAPAGPTREGYTFTGWDKTIPATMPAGDMTITAQWKDSEKPTGEIKINENSWKAFLNNITFGLFFKDTQTVTITAADNSGEAVTVEYLLSNKELAKAELDGKTFTVYTAPFGIDPDNEYIIYVRLTDTAGNTDYICSDGIVLDGTKPVILGIENGKTYCAAQTVTITEKYVDTVTVNGTAITFDENDSFLLAPADGEQKIVVTDKAGNHAEMTVTVNDEHTYEWQSENGEYWQKCKFCGNETTKKPIPEIMISGADRVCRTQDYAFSFKLPEGGKLITTGYEFEKIGGDLTATLENGKYTVELGSSSYPVEENGFKVTVGAETADGFAIKAEKSVTILNDHTGGKATCKDKAKCEVCGAEYGELDPKNHADLKYFQAKAATKTAEGNIEYWYCEACGKYFSDSDGTKEIKKAETVTAKLKDDSKSPQTGDTSNMLLWFALLFVSGGAAIGTTVVSRKKKYNK